MESETIKDEVLLPALQAPRAAISLGRYYATAVPRNVAERVVALPVDALRVFYDGVATVVGTRWHLPADTDVDVKVHVRVRPAEAATSAVEAPNIRAA